MDILTLKLLAISIVLGFLIGLERNISFIHQNEKGFAGSRTFSLISLFGFLAGIITKTQSYFFYLAFFVLGALVISAYFLKVIHYDKQGSTTHVAAILTFLIGYLVSQNEVSFAITLSIVIVFILNIKTKLKKIESSLSSKDISAAVLLLVMTFLVLPYLPDKMIFYFNPHKTWAMAVIIATLSFIGYLGIKFFGQKYGILLTGAAGGFISSTAVTFSISKLYKIQKNSSLLYTYAAAIAIANTIMFARVLIESLIVNKEVFFILVLPYTITTIVGVYISYRFYKKTSQNIEIKSEVLEKNPLELDEAIKFAIIFGFIYALVYFVGQKYGNIGIYIISFLSGITDVDAITLSLSSLANKNLSLFSAATGIAIASFTNSVVKCLIVWIFGEKELAVLITKFFGVILSVFVLSFLGVYFFGAH
ncbi:MgtC/SapB family protein [Caminibacter pacificus]